VVSALRRAGEVAVLDAGRRLLIADPARFDGVRVFGVDEHVRRDNQADDTYPGLSSPPG